MTTPPLNPYAAPPDISAEDAREVTAAAPTFRDDDDDPVSLKVNIPALGLIATSWLRAIFDMSVAVGMTLAVFSFFARYGTRSVFSPYHMIDLILMLGALVWSWLSVTATISIAKGASALRRRTGYFAAQRAAWLALVPLSPLFVLQFPFGLWALKVLADGDVRAAFGKPR